MAAGTCAPRPYPALLLVCVNGVCVCVCVCVCSSPFLTRAPMLQERVAGAVHVVGGGGWCRYVRCPCAIPSPWCRGVCSVLCSSLPPPFACTCCSCVKGVVGGGGGGGWCRYMPCPFACACACMVCVFSPFPHLLCSCCVCVCASRASSRALSTTCRRALRGGGAGTGLPMHGVCGVLLTSPTCLLVWLADRNALTAGADTAQVRALSHAAAVRHGWMHAHLPTDSPAPFPLQDRVAGAARRGSTVAAWQVRASPSGLVVCFSLFPPAVRVLCVCAFQGGVAGAAGGGSDVGGVAGTCRALCSTQALGGGARRGRRGRACCVVCAPLTCCVSLLSCVQGGVPGACPRRAGAEGGRGGVGRPT